MALVVTDQSQKVRYFDAMEWNFIRLSKSPQGQLNVWGCFECGEVAQLLYDKGNDKFYIEWIGH